jgi:hypothetical protein
MVQEASDYLSYWLCKALFLGFCWQTMLPIARPRQKTHLAAALWLATKLLCACTDLPLPASTPKALRVLGLLSCLAPKPTDEALDRTYDASWVVVSYLLMWLMVAVCLVLKLVCVVVVYAWRTLKAVLAAVSCVFSVVSRSSSLLVMLGAAEMLAVSAVAQWWRAQHSKLHIKYKYVRRIWRRTGGDVGPFLWQLLHGIESSQASAASGSKSGGKWKQVR